MTHRGVEVFCKVGKRKESELVALLRKHHFEFTEMDNCHVLPHPLPKNYPDQRPENRNEMRGGPFPLPVAYLDGGKLYISNEDIPELKKYHARLRDLLAEF